MIVFRCFKCHGMFLAEPAGRLSCSACGAGQISEDFEILGPRGLARRFTHWYWNLRFRWWGRMARVEYRIDRFVGQGEWGDVHFAHSACGSKVALKIVENECADISEIFEAHSEGSCVRTLDSFPLSPRRYGIVMEAMPESLADRLAQPFSASPARAIDEIFVPLCNAVQNLHEAGIVHKNLKPSNCFFGRGGEVKTGDLLTPETATREPDNAGEASNGWSYAAPEQMQEGMAVTALSDMYALGCMFFEVLTGRRVFAKNTSAEYATCHIHYPPPVPSLLNPRIPRDLSHSILRLLAKKREKRFASPKEFLESLVPSLVAALEEGNLSERFHAARALGKMGDGLAPLLVETLKKSGWNGKSFALRALSWTGARSLPFLLEALSVEPENVRRKAADLLFRVCEDRREAVSCLAESLRNRNRDVRWVAAQLLGSLKYRAADSLPALLGAMRDEDPFVRTASVEALGEIGPDDSAVVEALAESLSDPFPFVRFAASEALAGCGPAARAACPTLLASFEGESTVNQLNLTKALDHISHSEFLEGEEIYSYWSRQALTLLDPRRQSFLLARRSKGQGSIRE